MTNSAQKSILEIIGCEPIKNLSLYPISHLYMGSKIIYIFIAYYTIYKLLNFKNEIILIISPRVNIYNNILLKIMQLKLIFLKFTDYPY